MPQYKALYFHFVLLTKKLSNRAHNITWDGIPRNCSLVFFFDLESFRGEFPLRSRIPLSQSSVLALAKPPHATIVPCAHSETSLQNEGRE